MYIVKHFAVMPNYVGVLRITFEESLKVALLLSGQDRWILIKIYFKRHIMISDISVNLKIEKNVYTGCRVSSLIDSLIINSSFWTNISNYKNILNGGLHYRKIFLCQNSFLSYRIIIFIRSPGLLFIFRKTLFFLQQVKR